jgi:hypothetical protein
MTEVLVGICPPKRGEEKTNSGSTKDRIAVGSVRDRQTDHAQARKAAAKMAPRTPAAGTALSKAPLDGAALAEPLALAAVVDVAAGLVEELFVEPAAVVVVAAAAEVVLRPTR